MPSPPGKITFGKQLKSLEAGGFIFTETYHPPGFGLSRHRHECANFNFTVSGHFRETTRGRSEECGPSSLVIKPAGEAHSNRYGPSGAHCLIVEITPARLGTLAPHRRVFDAPASLRRGPVIALAARMYAELRAGGCASELVLEGLTLELLGHLARRRAKASSSIVPRWLREAQELLHESFAERLGLSTLAESAGIDPSHFARAFRRWFGCSVGEYVRRLRLQYAAEQLAASKRPLAEVALAAGFYDQSHFTNAFKLHMGLTPAEYRDAKGVGPKIPRGSRGFKRSTSSPL
jgi:AraC family transcriptional regulator